MSSNKLLHYKSKAKANGAAMGRSIAYRENWTIYIDFCDNICFLVNFHTLFTESKNLFLLQFCDVEKLL